MIIKSLPKILTCLFLLVFIIQMGCIIILLTLPQAALAERAGIVGNVEFMPQVEIPGLNQEFTKTANGGYALPGDISGIAKYIRVIYQYAIGIAGILAAVVLMFGGVLWIIAGGNSSQISEAKAWIGASLTGLVLALTSYLILYTVNPALVNLQVGQISKVTEMKIGCCVTIDNAGQSVYEANIPETTCTGEKKGSWQSGKCSTGTCTSANGNFCVDNSTEEECKNQGGTFARNKKCTGSCCEIGITCIDSKEITEQACKNAAADAHQQFKSYLAGGRCLGGQCARRE